MKTATGLALFLAGFAATATATDAVVDVASDATVDSATDYSVADYSATAASTASSSQCRVLPGDAKWPSEMVWDVLNKTVQGRLVSTVPLGHVCHAPDYDAAACAALQQAWTKPVTQSVLSCPFLRVASVLFR
jgi:hypothetical protein